METSTGRIVSKNPLKTLAPTNQPLRTGRRGNPPQGWNQDLRNRAHGNILPCFDVGHPPFAYRVQDEPPKRPTKFEFHRLFSIFNSGGGALLRAAPHFHIRTYSPVASSKLPYVAKAHGDNDQDTPSQHTQNLREGSHTPWTPQHARRLTSTAYSFAPVPQEVHGTGLQVRLQRLKTRASVPRAPELTLADTLAGPCP